ncbi:hypothetical protein Tco_1200528 [Tanacetum coccineum]
MRGGHVGGGWGICGVGAGIIGGGVKIGEEAAWVSGVSVLGRVEKCEGVSGWWSLGWALRGKTGKETYKGSGGRAIAAK